MMRLTTSQVQHIAKLARLTLTPEEAEKMTEQLGAILSYVDMLGEVDTSKAQPTAQVTGLQTVLREDELRSTDAMPDELLACSPLPLVERQIRAPNAHV